MASSFGSVEFLIVANERGFFPLPERDADGAAHYRATVKLASAADYRALADAVCLVTLKRALGSFAVVASVEAGPGSDTLAVPVEAGAALGTFTAVLVGLTPRASGNRAGDYRAEADWLLLTDVTP